MKSLIKFWKSEFSNIDDPIMQYVKVEYKKDITFAYNWIKNNPGKEFNYTKEAK